MANEANLNLHLGEKWREKGEGGGREKATSMKREGNVLSQAEEWKTSRVTGIGNLILPLLLLLLPTLSNTHGAHTQHCPLPNTLKS